MYSARIKLNGRSKKTLDSSPAHLSHAGKSQREKHALRLSRHSPYAGKLPSGNRWAWKTAPTSEPCRQAHGLKCGRSLPRHSPYAGKLPSGPRWAWKTAPLFPDRSSPAHGSLLTHKIAGTEFGFRYPLLFCFVQWTVPHFSWFFLLWISLFPFRCKSFSFFYWSFRSALI